MSAIRPRCPPYAWPGTEVGWGLLPDAAGKGYALEAATAAMDYPFDTLGWPEVIHCIDPQNLRSQALARRLGSRIQRKAFMPPPFDHDEIDVWGQTRDEWLGRRPLTRFAPASPAQGRACRPA